MQDSGHKVCPPFFSLLTCDNKEFAPLRRVFFTDLVVLSYDERKPQLDVSRSPMTIVIIII